MIRHPRIRRLGILLLAGCCLGILLFNQFRSKPTAPLSLNRFDKVPFTQSSFAWSTVAERYRVSSFKRLPKGKPRRLPRVQHDFGGEAPDHRAPGRQKAVRDVFQRGYESYKELAWERDELTPVSGAWKDTLGGWAATLIDSLDTLWIMEMRDEFYTAATVAAQLDWASTNETSINLFETTIRHLGGLLSAYDLSGETALLLKAKELGDMLYKAFDTPNRMPGFWVNFMDIETGGQLAGENDPSASPGSLSMEFTRLSQLTGDIKYFDAVDRVARFLQRTQNKSLLPGMWPKTIDFRNERVDTQIGFTIGALSDSLYEYLPKMHVLLGGQDPKYENMYREAMEVISKHLLFRPMLPEHTNILFAGDAYVHSDKIDHVSESQHLSCFAGGMFALGGKLFSIDEHVSIGERLAHGCAWAYDAFPSGVMPEIFNLMRCDSLDGECDWDQDLWEKEGDLNLTRGFKNARDPRYLLRPEAIESVFLLYRMTGKQELQDVAWRMFQSIVEATDTEYANSAIADVTVEAEQTEKLDSMESFWLSETLKYFYLMFSPPHLISLDEFVFNTEAHPFRRPK